MRRIALIGCSKRKMNDGKQHMAKDMYLGSNFLKAKNEGIKRLKCEDHFYILSGKSEYGLLDQDEMISYYDVYLGHLRVAERRKWADKVIDQLANKFDLRNTEFVIFAGNAYSQYIKERLNCVILKCNRRQITFEVKEELKNAR